MPAKKKTAASGSLLENTKELQKSLDAGCE
jgi:hypothetical protein